MKNKVKVGQLQWQTHNDIHVSKEKLITFNIRVNQEMLRLLRAKFELKSLCFEIFYMEMFRIKQQVFLVIKYEHAKITLNKCMAPSWDTASKLEFYSHQTFGGV